MTTVHAVLGARVVAPALRAALAAAGSGDAVLAFDDDLSCGPIADEGLGVREMWWHSFPVRAAYARTAATFWRVMLATDQPPVIWFGRHSASELAMFLAFADRMNGRPFRMVDVTGAVFTFTRDDGSSGITRPAAAAGAMTTDQFKAMLGYARPPTADELTTARQTWQRLKAEDAAFRIVSDDGMISTPADHYDSAILRAAGADWRLAGDIVGDVMFSDAEPFLQVGDFILGSRVAALVGQGRLEADGDPWALRTCRIRRNV